MVGIEVIEEIATDHITGRTFAAQGVGDKLEVFFQGVAAVDRLDEFDKAAYHVIIEVFVVADRDNIVSVHRVGKILPAIICFDLIISCRLHSQYSAICQMNFFAFHGINFLLHTIHRVPVAAGIGKPFHIQGVAAKHAAHGVGDQGNHRIPPGEHIVGALQRCGNVLFGIRQIVDSHVLIGHFWCQLVL